jgi:hypothetical protein
MNDVVHVSLAPVGGSRPRDAQRRDWLLDPRGARVILGGGPHDTLAMPIAPAADTLFGPRGVCAAADGTLWIADTGHHRVLGWLRPPTRDRQEADLLLGQPTFDREGRNAKGPVSAFTLNVPTGIAACGDALAVADAWNHRVLVWRRRPDASHLAPDLVLGQADFEAGAANRGGAEPRADTLFWPYCVAWDGARLWVADTGNRRVLMWVGLPARNGARADLVLGQPGFASRDENAGCGPDAASMRWPHAISFPSRGVCVADAGNNRLMLWRSTPAANNSPCDRILGQADVRSTGHNRGRFDPDARSLNMPYGAVVAAHRLVVADTANSRLLGWDLAEWPAVDAPARALAAQPDWWAKGDNRWRPPARDSVCWPYCVATGEGGDTLFVADSGNNRVLLWPLAEPQA